jgi:hypothetical protein
MGATEERHRAHFLASSRATSFVRLPPTLHNLSRSLLPGLINSLFNNGILDVLPEALSLLHLIRLAFRVYWVR